MALTSSSSVMSLAGVPAPALQAIANACSIPSSRIQDVYSCTSFQLSMISPQRNEVLHFVLSSARPVDPGPFCDALRQVVAHNAILRTRIVECLGVGLVNVVTDEEHVTSFNTGFNDIETFLQHEDGRAHHRFESGEILFRSAYVGQSFVVTIHHAVMDYWSIDKLLKLDTPIVYAGQPVLQRPPFKKFVQYCLGIDDKAAKAFWAPRFKGHPAVFPSPRTGHSWPRVVEKKERHVLLDTPASGAVMASSHMPLFIEAAWALTSSIYTDSESVAYGYVLSGRSATLNGIESTLGPTVAEVPVQVNLRRQTMTVDKFIKDRAASLRQLQQNTAVLQYSLDSIGALSAAAKTAAGFQTLFNIRPAVFRDSEFGTTTDDDNIKLRMVWLEGYYQLQLIFSIMEDGVIVWPRADTSSISDGQLERILDQFEHVLRVLIEVPSQTRLADLPLLDPRARADILQWNETIPTPSDKPLHELIFEDKTQLRQVAIETADGTFTYATMDRMSERIAKELRRRGISSGKLVGFMFEKSLPAIVALLGLLKAGGVCVPIDKHDDATVLFNLGAELLVTAPTQYGDAVGLAPDIFVLDMEMLKAAEMPYTNGNHVPDAEPVATAADPAFVFFNQPGSVATQQPVFLRHGNLATTLKSQADRLGWDRNTRLMQSSPFASPYCILEIFGTLLAGGTVCVPPSDESSLARVINSSKANWAVLPPNVIRIMSPGDVPRLKSVLLVIADAGHLGDDKTTRAWTSAKRFFMGWGDPEVSTPTTITELAPGATHDTSNIGKPVGCAVWIVSPENADLLAPLGGVGEMVIESYGVADAVSITEPLAGFIPPPKWVPSRNSGTGTETRFFRTGTLAKHNPNGSLSLIGRASNRIKLGGRTVQLENIEKVLLSSRNLRDAVVTAKISAGRTQLIGVVCLADPGIPASKTLERVPDHTAAPACRAVRDWAQCRLPPDQVPSVLHVVEELPRASSYDVVRSAVRDWVKTSATGH